MPAHAPPHVTAFRVVPIDAEAYDGFWKRHGEEIFEHAVEFRFWSLLSPDAIARLCEREAAHPAVPCWRFGVYAGEELVGIHTGRQQEHACYHMGTSGILPSWRRRGCYTRLLEHILEFARAKDFQCVTSRHNAANNAVLIAKLRAGFHISGFEVSDVQGTLVHLVHHFDDDRRSAHLFRTGHGGLPLRAFEAFTNLHAQDEGTRENGARKERERAGPRPPVEHGRVGKSDDGSMR